MREGSGGSGHVKSERKQKNGRGSGHATGATVLTVAHGYGNGDRDTLYTNKSGETLKWNTSTCENEVNRDQGRIKWGGLEFGGMGLERRRDTYYTIDRTYFTDPHLFSTSFARIQSLTIQLLPIIGSANDAIQGSGALPESRCSVCPYTLLLHSHATGTLRHLSYEPIYLTPLHVLLPTVQPASRAYETSSMDVNVMIFTFEFTPSLVHQRVCYPTRLPHHSRAQLRSRHRH
jgi:hypothetical protein